MASQRASATQVAQDAPGIKLTRGTSCVLCQQRKVRCDKNKPCSNCVKANVECRVVPPQPPRRRKKRLHEKDLVERLKKYEDLLRDNGVKFDSLDHDLRGDRGEEDVDDLENDFEALKTTPEESASPSSTQGSKFRPGPWFSVHKEFRASEKLFHDSSDEEGEVNYSTIYKAFDKMFGNNQDIFPLIIGYSGSESVTDAHPSTIHIFQLWQTYIDNVNTLLKVTHVPTIQSQVIEASSNLEQAPKNIEALMFAIYVMALTSLDDEQVRARFNAPKQELLGRYFAALQQALVNAGFMRSRDHITLQAYILYLLAIRWFMDPRQVFCLVGLAVRMAQQQGLHRDPEGHGLPAFEVEQRRRLWWTIVGYDRRLGEMTGSTVTALSSGCDTKLPLNVNDSDLHIERDDPPTSHVGATEMLFALARTELSMAVSTDSNRDSFNTDNGEKPNAAIQKDKADQPTIRIVGQNMPTYTLEGFCAHIEGTYLTHCDARIPLHFFTQTMIRQNLCKMRVVSFLVKMLNPSGSSMDEIERDKLFLEAIKMVEYDNIVQTADSLKPFRWYSLHYFPFPAYMFLVHELRKRTSGPLVEQAWEAITINHDARGILNNLHSPMHVAFGPLFLKAFAAREAAEHAAGRTVPIPPFIVTLRARDEKRRKGHEQNLPDPAPASEAMVQGPIASAQSSHSGDASNIVPPGSAPYNHGGGSQMSGPASSDTNDMDWSYIMSGYQGNNLFQELTGFPSFGSQGPPNPMMGMGGPPPPPPPPPPGNMNMGPDTYGNWKQ